MGIYFDDFVSPNSNGIPIVRAWIDAGESAGSEEAGKHYPYAISRNEAEVRQFAERKFQERATTIINNYGQAQYDRTKREALFSNVKEEAKRLYVAAYIGRYLERVAELDKKAGKTPATAAASATGATVKVVRVEQNANERVYYLAINDPGYTNGWLEISDPLVISFQG